MQGVLTASSSPQTAIASLEAVAAAALPPGQIAMPTVLLPLPICAGCHPDETEARLVLLNEGECSDVIYSCLLQPVGHRRGAKSAKGVEVVVKREVL